MAEILSTPDTNNRGNMTNPSRHETDSIITGGDRRRSGFLFTAYISFVEFLGLPLIIVILIIASGILIYQVDRAQPDWTHPLRYWITDHMLKNSDSTGALLDMMGGGVLTMTSIIVSMLLLVLQQSAGNMGNMIYDQFLQRRSNQLYAGMVIGTVVLVLLTSSTVSQEHNPVFGAAFALIMVITTVVMLLFFLYFTIQQMRPEWIIRAIHQRTLAARHNQLRLIAQTRTGPSILSDDWIYIRSTVSRHLIGIDLQRLDKAVEMSESACEVVILRNIGTYIHHFDGIAEVRAFKVEDARQVAMKAGEAFRLAQAREMNLDPGFGLEQLEMTAWTDMSSAKHNPETGMQVVYSLRDILSRLIVERPEVADRILPVVIQDQFPMDVMGVLESLSVVAVEGLQHQNMTEIIKTLNLLYDPYSPALQARSEEMFERLLPVLDRFVFTRNLEDAIRILSERLDRGWRCELAGRLLQLL